MGHGTMRGGERSPVRLTNRLMQQVRVSIRLGNLRVANNEVAKPAETKR